MIRRSDDEPDFWLDDRSWQRARRTRLPHTMQEAFGPYTSHELHDPDDDGPPRLGRLGRTLYAGAAGAALVLGVLLL